MATRSRYRSDSLPGRRIKNSFVPPGSVSPTSTQQQVPTIKLTTDCKGKGKAVNDCGTRTPITNAFMSQRSSISSTKSDSTTKPDLSHMPTATPTPGHSTTLISTFPSPPASTTKIHPPQNAYTPTPARGYRFTVDSEGYSSETSSVYTVRPIKHDMYVSGASSPRRDNPKASGLNVGGDVCLQVPAPKEKPVFDVVTEYQGLKLCRVSDAVPYLLGTRNMFTRLASITEDSLRHTPSISSFNHISSPISSTSSSFSSPQKYTPLDLSLMAILHSLHNPPSTRQRTGNWYPQGLATHKESLILYEHTAAHGPEQTTVSLSKFVDMARTWLLIRNPANVSGDPPKALNSWIDIITKLRKANVDTSKIDTKLYSELTTVLEGEALERRISEIAQWSKTGHLDRRYAVWHKHVEAKKRVGSTQTAVTTAGSNQTPVRTDGLYSKRFTHKHPLGRPKSLISEDEKAERRADKAAKAFALATAAALEAQKRERAAKEGGVLGGVSRHWVNRKKRNTAIFVLFIVLALGPLVGALLWAMVMHKFDWTPGAGEGY